MAKLCMGCMNPLSEDSLECKVCGFDISKDKNPEHCLPVTASLQGHYIVGRLMGEFPDHLLYLAYDRQMKEPCFIQEFFPASIGRRDTIGGVQPLDGCNKVFEEYADRFRTTMRILARMRELPAVVPVYDIFEENGTVYAVSDYCQGMTLTKKIKLSGGRIPWPEARSIFMSLLSSLSQLSDAGICHLAICPDNILIGSDGKARLRNFSIAAAHTSGTDLTPDLHTGYAAPEQYCTDEEVGVPADVYAVAATIFRTVTGTEPPAGDNRAKNSDDLFMSAEVAEELTQPVCVALFNALQVLPERRTAGLAQLRDQLSVNPQVSALVTEAQADIAQSDETDEEEEPRKNSRGGLIAMLIISLALLLIAVGVIVWMIVQDLGGGKKSGGAMDSGKDTSTTASQTDTPPVAGEGEAAVADVLGWKYEEKQDEAPNGMPLELIGFVHDSTMPVGTIVKQYPLAGDVQEVGDPIYVVVNSKPGNDSTTVSVPNLIGWKEANAKFFLEYMGFTVKVVYRSNDKTQDEGLVCAVYPGAGSEAPFNSTVELHVSTKKPTKTVPNLAGASEADVKTALELLGFVVQSQPAESSLLEQGMVESVDQAGTQQAIGTTIVIYVSQGPSVDEPVVDDPTVDTPIVPW